MVPWVKRGAVAMQRSRRPNSAMVGSSMWPKFWAVIPRPFVKAWLSWKGPRTSKGIGTEKKGWTQATRCTRSRLGREFSEGAQGSHGRRSDAGRSEMDQSVASADFAAAERTRHAGGQTGGRASAASAWFPTPQGSEESGDGQSPGPQRPVREYRPLEEGVSGGGLAGHQHRHEKEGIAGEFLSRRRDRNPRNHRGQRSRFQQPRARHPDSARHLRRGQEPGLLASEHEPRYDRIGL